MCSHNSTWTRSTVQLIRYKMFKIIMIWILLFCLYIKHEWYCAELTHLLSFSLWSKWWNPIFTGNLLTAHSHRYQHFVLVLQISSMLLVASAQLFWKSTWGQNTVLLFQLCSFILSPSILLCECHLLVVMHMSIM